MRIYEIINEYVHPDKHKFKSSEIFKKLEQNDYYYAMKAYSFVSNYTVGTRKDNITPEFDHQISIVRFLLKFTNDMMFPEETLATALLHDVCEDYNISYSTIKAEFNNRITRATVLVTKEINGVKRIPENYFNSITHDPIASIVKGADRIHNLHTLTDFPQHKKDEQSKETTDWIIPMLRQSKQNFPQQSVIYDKFLKVIENKLIRLQ